MTVGTVSFTISVTKSKLYAEQMDCVIFSEHGIVMTTESDFHNQEQQLDHRTISYYLEKLKDNNKKGGGDI